jgi:hypothetical protein
VACEYMHGYTFFGIFVISCELFPVAMFPLPVFFTLNTILLRNGSRTEPFPRLKLVTSLFPLLHAFTNAVQLCTHDIE